MNIKLVGLSITSLEDLLITFPETLFQYCVESDPDCYDVILTGVELTTHSCWVILTNGHVEAVVSYGDVREIAII